MKQFKHLGAYGLIIKDEKIVLIKKVGGPYNGKLDLPGGTIEWGETPEQTLIRELNEEVGIDVIKYELFDANSIVFEWIHKEELERGHHLGIFYKVLDYNNELLEDIKIDEKNDDSLGAKFYEIGKLKKSELSDIANLEIEKLGYKLED
ncbi:nUDIX hydrolase [Firmicutes bacterium CAG:884]|nr:nUDIX hydrolase [Firmicutes bacterium CAG:884]